MYPDVGTFVLIRPTQTFYERIKVVNKSRRAELSSAQNLADVGTEDGDTLTLYYSTVFG